MHHCEQEAWSATTNVYCGALWGLLAVRQSVRASVLPPADVRPLRTAVDFFYRKRRGLFDGLLSLLFLDNNSEWSLAASFTRFRTVGGLRKARLVVGLGCEEWGCTHWAHRWSVTISNLKFC